MPRKNNMTKVALVGPVYPFRGGIAHYTSHLASHLEEAGVEVRVFSFRRQYPSWLYPGESDRDPSLEPIKSSAIYDLDPIYPWTWEKCFHQIKSFEPDLVLIPWWTTFWGLAFVRLMQLSKKADLRTAVLIHNVIPHEAKPWDRYLTRLTLSQTNYFIVQTQSQKTRLLEILPNAEIRMAPHPVYDQFPGKKLDAISARRQLLLPDDRRIILFLGIIRKYKGLHPLIDAMAVLKKRGENLHLVIAGEFWDPLQEYQSQIDQLGLADNTSIFPGYAPNEQLPVFLSAANLLAAPYTGGTQSGVVKLAMGFGLPVLVSKQITDDLIEQFTGRGVTISGMESTDRLADDLLAALKQEHKNDELLTALKDSWGVMIEQILAFAEKR